MYTEFTQEQQAFRREVIAAFQDARKPEWLSLDLECPEYLQLGREMDRTLIERGWYAMHWPKEYGGGGGDHVHSAILRELEGYFKVPTYGGHGRYIVGPALVEFGTTEQKQRYLPRIINGELVICLGFTEPNAGSDLAAMEAKAVKSGSDFIISGSKLYITYGEYANSMLLAARTDPSLPKHKGVSLFLVDMDIPGITRSPLDCLTGHRISEVHFDDVRIPESCLLGTLNQGFYHMAVALNFERSGLDWPARYMSMLEDVVEHCRAMGQWSSSRVREIVGNLAAQIEAWRMICWRVVHLQARGQVPSWEASLAQFYRKDVNPQFGRALLEIFGADALVERGDARALLGGRVEWYLRETFNNHGQGGRFVTRNVVARRGLRLPGK